jgi:hypothetical protein
MGWLHQPDLNRIIDSCTKLIETPGIDPIDLGRAFSRRAYGYHRLGHYRRATRDLDETTRILAQSTAADAVKPLAVSYNNRAAADLAVARLAGCGEGCAARSARTSFLRLARQNKTIARQPARGDP